ncbi:MAG: HemX, putative uroporphyrinogen-III C-methyltransferase [Pseudomonadota bacterium]
MAAELDQVNTKTAKQMQSEALGKGLWRALWIAIAVCLVWLVIEGGLRLYHRPVQLDARVLELETQLSKVLTQEAEINIALKSSLENQKNLAPVANQLNQLLGQVAQLPMNALPVAGAPTVASNTGAQTVIQKVMTAIQGLGDQLMRIQVVGDVKDVAMTPAAQDLIRQQLRLHFLSARLAWLSQLPQASRDDLVQAEQLIAKHFQAQASSVVQIQKNISELRSEVSKSIPVNKGQ